MAIPINELRIGNVFWEDYGGYKIVTAIGFNNVGEFPNHVQGRAIGFKASGLFDADKIDPVPLSEKILIACGFEKNDNSNEYWTFWQLKNSWHICESHHDEPSAGVENGCFHWGENYLKVASLHQLQNLYQCLVGKELSVDFTLITK